MNEIMQRLNEIMIEQGIKQVDLANIAGVSSQAVHHWFKRNTISMGSARAICLSTGYSLEWLISGKGNKKTNNSNMQDSRLRAVEWESISNTEKDSGEFVTVPVLDIELSAGHGSNNDNENENEMYKLPFRAYTLKKNGIPVDQVKVVRVSGDSMEPRLFDEDTIAINMCDTRIRDGKIYAVRVFDSQKVKVLIKNSDGTVTLRSLNSNYRDEIISREQIEGGQFQILGRMWWHSSIDI